MGFIYKRPVNVGHGFTVNESGSGASITKRVGPVSVNSRGHIRIHIARGLSFRVR